MIGGFHGNPIGFFNSLMSPHLFSSSGVSLVKTVSSLEVSHRGWNGLTFGSFKEYFVYEECGITGMTLVPDSGNPFKKGTCFKMARKQPLGLLNQFEAQRYVQQLLPASQQLQRSCLSKQKSWGHDCLSATSCHRPCMGRPWAWCWRKNVFELLILSILNQNLILVYTHSIRVMCCLAMGPYTKPSSQNVGHLLSPWSTFVETPVRSSGFWMTDKQKMKHSNHILSHPSSIRAKKQCI